MGSRMANEVDYHALSLRELKALRKEVERALEAHEQRRKAEALAAVEAALRERGFTIDELMAHRSSKLAGTKVPPKYRDPVDASNTWSGRGRAPRWFEEAVRSGTSADALLIATP